MGRENNGLQHRRRRETEGGKNRDKKVVIVRLIIQKNKPTENNKKHQVQEQLKLQPFVKVLELFLRCPIHILAYNWNL
jgi:hypothetical protein